MESQITAQDKAIKIAEAKAEIAEQMLKDQVVETEKQKSANEQKTASNSVASASSSARDDSVDTQLTETLTAPPQKPPLPLNLAAQDGDMIATNPTLAPEDVGLTQVQLASYSSIKNAENGLNILLKEMPKDVDVSLQITTARLASGKNVFRVVSSAVPVETAKMICTHYWAQQYACIIKMTSKS